MNRHELRAQFEAVVGLDRQVEQAQLDRIDDLAHQLVIDLPTETHRAKEYKTPQHSHSVVLQEIESGESSSVFINVVDDQQREIFSIRYNELNHIATDAYFPPSSEHQSILSYLSKLRHDVYDDPELSEIIGLLISDISFSDLPAKEKSRSNHPSAKIRRPSTTQAIREALYAEGRTATQSISVKLPSRVIVDAELVHRTIKGRLEEDSEIRVIAKYPDDTQLRYISNENYCTIDVKLAGYEDFYELDLDPERTELEEQLLTPLQRSPNPRTSLADTVEMVLAQALEYGSLK